MGKGVRLVNIKRVTSRGKVFVYRRVRGKHIRLPNLPENHPEFLKAYLDAENLAAADDSLSELITCFLGSSDFRRRKLTTQRVWRRRLDAIRLEYGKAPVAALEVKHITKALRKKSPGAARSERTIWRALMDYAIQEGWRDTNPAKEARIAKHEVRPHAPWSQDDVATFRERWPVGSSERQAFEVVYWTGARCVDAATLGWQHVSGGILEYVQEKTEGTAVAPVAEPVDEFLREDLRHFLQCAGKEMLFITKSRNCGRSVKALSQLISRAARDAGLQKRTAHGLRKSRAIILAESHWTPHQIGAWTGHESLQEIAHYTRDANKRALVMGKQAGKHDLNSGQVIGIKRK